MSDPYADWDGAYVLGALSSAERREYEEHVDGCARCAAALAELGMLPGLLRLVPDEDGAAYLDAEPAPPPVAPAVPVPHRRPRRRVRLLAAAAAVVVVGGVGAGVVVADRNEPPARGGGETVALASVVPNPLRASVSLTPTSWGTKVAMTCTYGAGYGGTHSYDLYVVDTSGHRQLVARWRAGPGDTARTTGATDLAPRAISRVELRGSDGTLLLAADV
ncbi:zf-HC2 domain-containing protein [Nocardioides ginsengisoli]|uniref:Anti-sigma factor n=1 Tax=Nocardioides ginsengisoli TaxID=363868 RepID=A0ABW3W6D3_9ACTN